MLFFFVSSSDCLFFGFTSVHTAKLNLSNFLNDFLSLTAFVCVMSCLTLSAKVFFESVDFDHT